MAIKEYAVIDKDDGRVVSSMQVDEDNLPEMAEGLELREWQAGDAIQPAPPPAAQQGE